MQHAVYLSQHAIHLTPFYAKPLPPRGPYEIAHRKPLSAGTHERTKRLVLYSHRESDIPRIVLGWVH